MKNITLTVFQHQMHCVTAVTLFRMEVNTERRSMLAVFIITEVIKVNRNVDIFPFNNFDSFTQLPLNFELSFFIEKSNFYLKKSMFLSSLVQNGLKLVPTSQMI